MLLLCYIKNVTLQILGGQLSQLHQSSKQCTNVLYDVVVLTYVTPSSSHHNTKRWCT